jgi:hypothetical protein
MAALGLSWFAPLARPMNSRFLHGKSRANSCGEITDFRDFIKKSEYRDFEKGIVRTASG